MKKLLVFDYDNTIAQRESPISSEMISIFKTLLKDNYIAILTGGRTYQQLKNWVVNQLRNEENIDHLILCIEYGNIIYQKKPHWKRIYRGKSFNNGYKKEIVKVWKDIDRDKYGLELITGDCIARKSTVLTLQCLGNNIDALIKSNWDKDLEKRKMIIDYFKSKLHFPINMYATGRSSIDFVDLANDKASNVMRLSKILGISIRNTEYFGDEFSKLGNDYPILNIDMKINKVDNPQDTLSILKGYI